MFQNNYHYVRIGRHLKNSGFGLVELLVSISILVIVMSVILARHSAFNSAVLLQSQAYEVAFQAREIQLFAVGAIGESTDFRNVYGLHFDSTSGANQKYSLFRDGDGDNIFGSGEEFGRQGVLDPRFEISAIRGINSGGALYDNYDKLSILFERPNFDARFFIDTGTPLADEVVAVEVVVRLRGTTSDTVNDKRTVEITRTGQISVK